MTHEHSPLTLDLAARHHSHVCPLNSMQLNWLSEKQNGRHGRRRTEFNELSGPLNSMWSNWVKNRTFFITTWIVVSIIIQVSSVMEHPAPGRWAAEGRLIYFEKKYSFFLHGLMSLVFKLHWSLWQSSSLFQVCACAHSYLITSTSLLVSWLSGFVCEKH